MVVNISEHQYKTSCPRCRTNITYSQTLLENVHNIARNDIRAVCALCKTYKANICDFCTEVLRKFTVANIKYNTKGVTESSKRDLLSIKQRSTFPLNNQLFTSEPLQLKASLSINKKNKISLEDRANFDTNDSILKREDTSPIEIKNKISKTLPPHKYNKDFKPRKRKKSFEKSLPSIFTDVKAVSLSEIKPFIDKEKEIETRKINEICDLEVLGTLPKSNYNPVQIAAVSNTGQLANSLKIKKSVTFQKCEPNIERVHKKHNLQTQKSLPKLQDMRRPTPMTPYIALVRWNYKW